MNLKTISSVYLGSESTWRGAHTSIYQETYIYLSTHRSSASHTARHLFRTITETKGFTDQSDHWLSCKTYWSAVNVLHSVLVIKCHASIGMSLHIKASWQERYKRIIDDLPRTNSAQSCSLCWVCVRCELSCCRKVLFRFCTNREKSHRKTMMLCESSKSGFTYRLG